MAHALQEDPAKPLRSAGLGAIDSGQIRFDRRQSPPAGSRKDRAEAVRTLRSAGRIEETRISGNLPLHPIDVPHDDLARFKGFDEKMRARLAARVAEACAAGRRQSSEFILFDPRLGFVAYGLGERNAAARGQAVAGRHQPFHVERAPDNSRILDQVAAARAAGCDIVIVCLHRGAELEFFTLPVQLDRGHATAEAGTDAIIGTHPHVIPPVEICRPKADRRRHVPFLYSLGNLTPTMGADFTTLCLVANLTFSRGRLRGRGPRLCHGARPDAGRVRGHGPAACAPSIAA